MIFDFQKLLGCLRDLSRPELLTLDAAVRGILSAPPPPTSTERPSDMPGSGPTPSSEAPCEGIGAIEAAFVLAPECPHCQSKRIGRWGTANRLKRYRCKDCKISFNCLTGTPLAQLHKRELWAGHAQVLVVLKARVFDTTASACAKVPPASMSIRRRRFAGGIGSFGRPKP